MVSNSKPFWPEPKLSDALARDLLRDNYVLTVGVRRVPLEVKYRRSVGPGDARGLLGFIGRSHYNAPFGIMVVQDDAQTLDDPRIVTIPMSSLLLLR